MKICNNVTINKNCFKGLFRKRHKNQEIKERKQKIKKTKKNEKENKQKGKV